MAPSMPFENHTAQCSHPGEDANLSRWLQIAVDQSDDIVFMTSGDGTIQYVNHGFEAAYGFTKEDALGKTPRILKSDSVEAAGFESLWATILSGRQYLGEHHNRTRDGRTLIVQSTITPILGKGGLIQGFLAIQKDVTQHRRAERALEESENRIRRQLKQLAALRDIDKAISGSLDLSLPLTVALSHLLELVEMDAACVLLFNQYSQELEYCCGRGFQTLEIESTQVRLGKSLAGRAATERQPVRIFDTSREAGPHPGIFDSEGFSAYVALPLVAKGKLQGVLETFSRKPARPNLIFMETIAGQIAIAIEHSTLFHTLEASNTRLILAYDATIEALGQALQIRDRGTREHTARVTRMTVRLAQSLGVGEEDLYHIRRGALLHDIGKIGIPDSILQKPGPLNDQEWEIMRRHPRIAYEMLSPIEYLRPALDIPLYHHEKWDGTGYPEQIAGEKIPLAARIFAVVDVWDALSSKRPYSEPWPAERIYRYLREKSGTHFDPKVVDAFLDLIR